MIALDGHVVVLTGAGPGTGAAARLLGARGATVVGDDAGDLATRAGCEALVGDVLGRHGRVDALVHDGTAGDVALAWWLCRAVWPAMAGRSYGRVVLAVPADGVARAAALGLAGGLAGEGAACGILVNAVSGEAGADDVATLVDPGCRVTGQVFTGGASPAAQQAADDDPLETERHRFWQRLRDGA